MTQPPSSTSSGPLVTSLRVLAVVVLAVGPWLVLWASPLIQLDDPLPTPLAWLLLLAVLSVGVLLLGAAAVLATTTRTAAEVARLTRSLPPEPPVAAGPGRTRRPWYER